MIGETLWVAVLTGGTAVLASWVTSRGNARTARVQAEAAALAEDRSSVRQTRRTAYLDFLEQAHVTGELYYRLGDVYVQVADPNDQLARIDDLRSDLRDAFDPLMRAARMVVLEGPAAVAEAAEAVRQAASDANRAMWRITQSDAGARDHFDAARHVFQTHLTEFIEASRTAAAELR